MEDPFESTKQEPDLPERERWHLWENLEKTRKSVR